MIHTRQAYGGMVVAPHHLAADAGRRVLAEGGNAIEAMVAAAATIAVVYPHMNSIGGDNIWLLHAPGDEPVGIDACGAAARAATIDYYRERGFDAIPGRGPLAALTVAGALSGWQRALAHSESEWGGRLPLARLLEDATFHAREGVAVAGTLSDNTHAKLNELRAVPGFGDAFLSDGRPPQTGERFTQPALAQTLLFLARDGIESFYRGELAQSIAADLQAAGSPLALQDLAGHRALTVAPLTLQTRGHQVFNLPPPTQGLASLLLLGTFERLGVREAETFEFVHALVESTKQCFRVRDAHVTDPAYMQRDAREFLQPVFLKELAEAVDRQTAAPWPAADTSGDTVWLGAVDRQGRAVSFIQSIFWEFGSGVVLPDTGITWQNRGMSFSLDETHHNCLRPGRRPFHTIQPALAKLRDGRVMPYGTMGGDGQPQTQAMVFTRYALYGQELQRAITAPRWLLGKTWGSEVTTLRIEDRFDDSLLQRLRAAGHDLEMVGSFEEIMGHAGALVHHPHGLIEGAADPRSDGAASGC